MKIPLILRVGFLCLFSIATVRGQSTNAILLSNLLQSARGEFTSNHYPEAAQFFRVAVVAAPTNAEAYAGLGRSLYNLKQYPEAITNLERALALQPSHTNWLLCLGESYSSAGNPSKAVNVLQRYVSLRTNDDEGYTWLSYALLQEAQYDKSASAARRAIALNPTNAYCYQQMGYCFYRLNRYEDAVRAFRQAIVLDPKDGDSYFGCGMNLIPLGRLDEATTNFEAACKIQRNNRAAHVFLFACYLSTMQPRKAYELVPWVFVASGCAVLVAYLMGLASLLLLSFRVRPKPFPGIWFSLTWLVVYVEGQLALLFVLGMLFQTKPTEALLVSTTLGGLPVLIAGMLGFRRQPWGKPFAWPLHLGSKRIICFGLAGLVLIWLFNWGYMGLVQLVTHHLPIQETLPLIEPALKADPLIAFLAVAILMPVVEEILFRGLLYGALERRLPTAGSITVTALVFALCHFQLVFFIPLLGVGVLLGWARSKTGSIGLPILIHALNNGLSLLLVVFGS